MTESKEAPKVSQEELRRTLWAAIKRDFVEEGTRQTELVKKYQVSRTSVFRHHRDENWAALREDFIRLPRNEMLHVADEHEQFFDWMRASSRQLGARFLKTLSEKATSRVKGAVDTMESIAEDAAAGLQLVRFAEACYGPMKELPPPLIDYEVVVTEQTIKYRIRLPDEPEIEPIVIDIPPEDVHKYDPALIIGIQKEGGEHVEE